MKEQCKFEVGDVIWNNWPCAPHFEFRCTVMIVIDFDNDHDECLVEVIRDDHDEFSKDDLPVMGTFSIRHINSHFHKAPRELQFLVDLFYA